MKLKGTLTLTIKGCFFFRKTYVFVAEEKYHDNLQFMMSYALMSISTKLSKRTDKLLEGSFS